ncbi:Glutamyl-tRNA synthetase class Ib archaeal/eukaryotic cytosolic [Penicillium concentricum]|uniref:Glutamyl-tRNA synthetase class Ib archaeal/eukaryotic cytosolic n=1 Tax=Penicillium concentricum TaxID=293559 RepID=A0A9W9S8I2_9EURO|nr:Glutamyl-tRNA synthetase class Ib archaeal/eukaryotic cytosolic [Penicillium concentricum]KAJ5374011.1 Glutamyl-tRNA synthetase class Ib archaeal/eukaryotic cytosolic [Penicillium concentricum]
MKRCAMIQFNLFVVTRASQAALLPVVLIVSSINEARPSPIVKISLDDTALLTEGEKSIIQFQAGDKTVTGTIPFIQELCAQFPFLVGNNARVENEWISRLDSFDTLDFKALDPILQRLDTHLLFRSFLSGYSLSTPNIALWGALRGNRVTAATLKRAAVESLNAASRERKLAKSREGASYDVTLKNTENSVVTSFPPEPSGYLHIEHAKAAPLFWFNDYFAQAYSISRFDDTNPSKEKQEFQDVILEDLALMDPSPLRFKYRNYASDYFDQLNDYCLQIIKSGKAYADDTDKETINHQRRDGIPSQRRDLSPQESLAHLEEMKMGTPEGLRWCIRAKISVDDDNKCLRDPVIYRCNPSPHHPTGNAWAIYPTYDFACPILDSMEGVAHALRTSDRDRSPQYQWMLDTLNLRTVQVWDFSRMNFIRTLLSKRKLTTLVERGVVWGWDDPRFPTIRGMRRRGMTIPALREFILKQGPSKNATLFYWDLIWATNKKYIDPISPRYTAIETKAIAKATVTGGPANSYTKTRPKHVKNTSLGDKVVPFSSSIVLEQVDAKSFNQDEEITLMNWGNAIVRKISTDGSTGKVMHLELELHMAGDVKKTEKEVTWLSTGAKIWSPSNTLEEFLNFNTEFRVSGLADCNVSEVNAGDILQFDRKGFYRVDRAPAPGVPGVFFNIPTGKQK